MKRKVQQCSFDVFPWTLVPVEQNHSIVQYHLIFLDFSTQVETEYSKTYFKNFPECSIILKEIYCHFKITVDYVFLILLHFLMFWAGFLC